ncbi:hypothetical protein [Tenuibacillus multivorans]|uniref:Uncharacterized protein n=1 Tax=Tenuibacillus multivorans TaxID=237069 RepID=A0A1H0CGH1_9BACI|nr:hypothetical protein [Tenuibacillus multivorans]GEL76305.1 hypothetical protein TMU01_05400 [Tenuibacillus multivorans]SDN56959.1 hypothetical protein SAMN05216498_2529 [Tenuibacillus multivorans]
MEIKNPIEIGIDWTAESIKELLANLLTDFILVFPVLAGVSIGVYALLSMISEGLAKLGVIGVFVYGGLLVVVL